METRTASVVGRSSEFAALAQALAKNRSVIVVGSPGIGKTAFLQAAAERLPDRPRAHVVARAPGLVLQVHGDPPVPAVDITTAAQVQQAFPAEAGHTPLLVFVDDAHLLPSEPATALISAADRGTIQLVLATTSVTTDAAAAPHTRDALRRFWSVGSAKRIELSPLSRPATAKLLAHLAAPDPIGEPWSEVLYRLSGGSPVLLHTLFAAAQAHGDFDRPAPLTPGALPYCPPRAALDLIGPQLAGLPTQTLAALSVLARIRSLSLPRAQELVPPASLFELLEHGLVHTVYGTETLQVPELLLAAAERLVPTEQLLEALHGAVTVLAETVTAGVPLTDEEAVFVGTSLLIRRVRQRSQHLFNSATARKAVLRAATLFARSDDPESAARLAHLLLQQREDPAARLVLARAQTGLHQYAAAHSTLNELEPPADEHSARGLLAARHYLVFWHLGETKQFLEYLRTAATWFPSNSVWQRTVEVSRVASLAFCFGGTEAPAPQPAAGPGAALPEHPETCGNGSLLLQILMRATGDNVAPHLHLLRGRRGIEQATDVLFVKFMTEAFLRLLSGNHDGLAEDLCRARAQASQEHRLLRLALLSWVEARLATRQGDQAAAIRALQRYLLPSLPEVMRAVTMAELATLYAQSHDLAAAEAAYAEAASCPLRDTSHWYRLLLELAGCELQLVRGREVEARKRAMSALLAKGSAAQQTPLLTAGFADVALRAGAPSAHVEAALRSIAQGSTDPQFTLLIERVHTTSAQLHSLPATVTRSGPQPTAHPLPSPQAGAHHVDRAVAPVALELLTVRELQLVRLATSGMSNRQIAQQLHLSVRTVESHLHHARTKLGLSGRQSLLTLLQHPGLSH